MRRSSRNSGRPVEKKWIPASAGMTMLSYPPLTMTIYSQLASIFEYPAANPAPQAEACATALDCECAEAATLMRTFRAAIESKTLGEVQELYIATFDMRPDCTPALGYHLFGDDVRRSLLLIRLKERLDAHHIDAGSELADHLSLVLRLMESSGPGEERDVLAADCLVPAVTRMAKALGTPGESAVAGGSEAGKNQAVRNPYAWALEALLAYFQRKEAGVAAG